MRILLLESSPGVGAETALDLAGSGHVVLRCHTPGEGAFPCVGLNSPGSCPLEGHAAADVAITVRAPDDTAPTSREIGVTCALRQGVPVVVEQDADDDPFAGWTLRVGASGPVAACELALRAAQTQEVEPLRAEVVRILSVAGVPDAIVDVHLERSDGRAHVFVTVHGESPIGLDVIAVRVHARYSESSRASASDAVDISVRSIDGTHELRAEELSDHLAE